MATRSLLRQPRSPRRASRGIVTVVTMLLVISIIVFALSKMLDISSGNVADGQRLGDSTAALYLAESGLEAAQQTISGASNQTDALCTGLNSPASTSLGRGSYGLTGVSSPATCGTTGNPMCTDCLVTSTATVGLATRTLRFNYALGASNGTTCNSSSANCTNSTSPPAWHLNLVNDQGAPAIAVFSLAASRQGNNTGVNCGGGAPCKLEWNIDSANGSSSVASMGNAVPVAVNGSYLIYQQLSANYNVAEVGALFVGSVGNPPTLTGPTSAGVSVPGGAAYWYEKNGAGGTGTVGRTSDTTGTVNDGTWTDPTLDTCTTAPAPGNNSQQACTNWCYGGDTLVMGFAGNATTLSDQVTAASFNTVALTRVAHYPSASISGAPTDTYAEIWYVRNPDYLSNALAASSGGQVTASIGSSSITATFSAGSNQMNVSATTGKLHVGDTLVLGAQPTLAASPATITAAAAGGGTGTYTISTTCASNCNGNKTLSTKSATLEVTAVANGYLSVGDTLTGTGVTTSPATTVSAIVGAGNVTGAYTVNQQQTVASTTITANGPTIHVSGGTVPVGGVPAAATIVAVRSVASTGVVPAGTSVLASPAPTATIYKLSATPTTRLVNATVCGGTCGLFLHGTSTTTTPFAITKSAGTGYWASGFMCIKGVQQNPLVVNSLQVANRRWQEVVN